METCTDPIPGNQGSKTMSRLPRYSVKSSAALLFDSYKDGLITTPLFGSYTPSVRSQPPCSKLSNLFAQLVSGPVTTVQNRSAGNKKRNEDLVLAHKFHIRFIKRFCTGLEKLTIRAGEDETFATHPNPQDIPAGYC